MRIAVFVSICVLGLIESSGLAGTPRDELLKRVPDDVGFVVIVQDLRGLLERTKNSPFATKYLTTVRGKAAFNSPQMEQLNLVNNILKNEIGTEWPELRDGILGDAVVFIYKPGPAETPEKEESLVLIHAREPKLAERIYKFIDDAQTKSGQLKEKTTRTRGEQSYVKRVRTDEEDEYTFFNGALIAFGNSESLLQSIIDRDRKPESSKIAKEIDGLGLGSANFLWWINPRAFDAIMLTQQKKESGPAAVAINAIHQHWKALDGIALSYHLQHDSEMRLSFAARPEAMPASTRQFLTELATPSTLTTIFPKDSLVTMTSRLSLPAAMNFGSEFVPEATRSELKQAVQKSISAVIGEDVIKALPRQLGPDWGVCILGPNPGSKRHWPIALAAVKLSDSNDGPAVVARVMDGLNALATLAVVGFNSKNNESISLHAERQDSTDVRYVLPTTELAEELRPSFAWKGGYLLVASHTDGIRQFTPQATTSIASGGEASILNINLPAWTRYLREHRPFAVSLLTKQDGVTPEAAGNQIDAAVEVLDMFQSIGLTIKTEPGRAYVSFQIKPIESFARPEK